MSTALRLSLAPAGWAPPAPRAAERPASDATSHAASGAPENADAFAEAVIRAICAAGLGDAAARLVFARCWRALALGSTVRAGLRHPAKAAAIDRIWRERDRFNRAFRAANDRAAFLETLPGLGPVTAPRLARAFGLPASEPPARPREAA